MCVTRCCQHLPFAFISGIAVVEQYSSAEGIPSPRPNTHMLILLLSSTEIHQEQSLTSAKTMGVLKLQVRVVKTSP